MAISASQIIPRQTLVRVAIGKDGGPYTLRAIVLITGVNSENGSYSGTVQKIESGNGLYSGVAVGVNVGIIESEHIQSIVDGDTLDT
jgi:hypothetical protein